MTADDRHVVTTMMEGRSPASRPPRLAADAPADDPSGVLPDDLSPWLDRVAALADPERSPDHVVLLAELETAAEELRVADDELRRQRAELQRLAEEVRRREAWREQLAVTLPVAVVESDARGVVVRANPAAARLLGVEVVRMRGKPLTALVDETDRPAFRLAISELSAGARARALRGSVRPREGSRLAVSADVTALADVGDGDPHLVWTLLPEAAIGGAADGAGRHGSPAAVAASFAELVQLPGRGQPLREVLREVAPIVRRTVVPDVAVSVTLGSPAAPETVVTDSATAQRLDGAQVQLGAGPCVEGWARRELVHVADVATDPRWPALRPVAQQAGVGSIVAAPVALGDERVGGLNVYGPRAHAFCAADLRLLELLGSAVAAVVHTVRHQEGLRAVSAQLEEALRSRAVIDQAKGIVMARQGVDADAAFAVLTGVSQQHNVKVRELARMLVDEVQHSSGRQVGDVHDEDRS